MADFDAANQDESSTCGGGARSSSPLVKKIRYSEPDVKVILMYHTKQQRVTDL